MQRGLYLSAMRMEPFSVLPSCPTLSGASSNTTDSTKLGGSVAKANSTATTSSSPVLRFNQTQADPILTPTNTRGSNFSQFY